MNIKSIAIASAVALVSTGASAADLGRKAPAAVDYVKVCDTYGEGFFYIPGTDTCLKIGGYLRAYAFAGKSDFDYAGPVDGGRSGNSFATKARFDLQLDARSQTEFGLLRAMAEVRFNASTTGYNEDTGGRTSYGVATDLELAYIQWGGFTAGRAQSFFDFYTGYTIEEVYGEAGNPDAKTNLLAYTFGFGNGVTATLSLEDPSTSGRRLGYNQVFTSTVYIGDGGLKYPDLVGNVNVTQGWGSAQIMGALHSNYSNNSGFDNVDELGWAIGAGVQINLPMLGNGDMIAFQAVYGRGAAGYVSLDPYAYDYYADYGQSKALGLSAGYTHVFNSKWSGAIQVSYLDFKDPEFSGDSFKTYDLSASVTWTPVNNLSIDLGIDYRNTDFKYYEFSTEDGFAVVGRVTRKF